MTFRLLIPSCLCGKYFHDSCESCNKNEKRRTAFALIKSVDHTCRTKVDSPLSTNSVFSITTTEIIYKFLLRVEAGSAARWIEITFDWKCFSGFQWLCFLRSETELNGPRAFADNRRIYRLCVDLTFMVSGNWRFPVRLILCWCRSIPLSLPIRSEK